MRASSAFFVHAGLATLPFVLGDTTKAVSLCTTSFGNTSKNPVPTTTYGLTLTSRVTVKTTTTPKQTITPAPTTNTYSTTTTATVTVTLPQVTDTFTEIDTLTQTSTESDTVTATTTTTTTTSITSTNTVTIAVSAGFTPVSSNVPAKRDLSLNPKQPRAPAGNRPTFNPKKLPTTKISLKGGKQTCSPAVYPTRVACGVLAEVIRTSTIVSTAPIQTVTATPPPPISTTTTFGTTVTTTTMPVDASTTVTTTTNTLITSTTTSTSTVTETATATVNVQAPDATYYAACGPSNQQSTVNGVTITSGVYNYGLTSYPANSAYDCCVACLNDATCGVTAFGDGVCYGLTNGGTCSQSNAVLQVFTGAGDGLTVSNSYCGSVTY